MEDRKAKEIAYYDEEVKNLRGFAPAILGSCQFLYKIAASLITGKKVLDYGCGNGVHAKFLAEHAREVVGIDLSQASLALARNKAQETIYKDRVQFLEMDCEAMEFSDSSFEVVFDGGTFSSLDFEKARGEISRVLRPEGALVGIETFGHNPVANAKRVLNRLTGKRTAWAASHIVRQKELARLKQSFESCQVYYFHLVSLFAFPFLGLPGGSFVLGLLERVDHILLRFPFLQKYAFKIVFICKNVKKTL